jgi:hypothetical protein
MKTITICNPYPSLIFLPATDPRWKGVENRTWETLYRGPLLIHAGKSRQWLEGDNYGIPLTKMVFGAIVGIVEVVDCFHAMLSRAASEKRHPWLAGHQHVEGPFCHVYGSARKFAEPIPYRGAQGMFNVPDELVREAIEKARPA